MASIPPKYTKYIRPSIGVVVLLLGLVFMFVPFIPLGYIFIAAILILLSYEIPLIRHAINRIKKNGNGDKIEKIEKEVDDVEEEISEHIVDDESK